MPNPIIGLIMIGVGVATYFAFDFLIMTGALTLAGVIWSIIGIAERIARRPRRDDIGLFHDGATGQFISGKTYVRTYTGIGVGITMPIFTKLDTLTNLMPAFVAAPPEYQLVGAFATNTAGWLLS